LAGLAFAGWCSRPGVDGRVTPVHNVFLMPGRHTPRRDSLDAHAASDIPLRTVAAVRHFSSFPNWYLKHVRGYSLIAHRRRMSKLSLRRLVVKRFSKGTFTMYDYVKTWLEIKTDKRAVTALEYGLIAGVLVVTVLFGFQTLGSGISTKFNNIKTALGT
jgi:Flp pilus assembly pilin Flp